MKYFLIFIAAVIFSSCSSQVQPMVKYIEPQKTISQELGQRVFICDSTLNARDMQIKANNDSIDKLLVLLHSTAIKVAHQNDSLKTALFLANYKVEKVKYYLKICNKNPTNNKFLKGWVTRAVN